MKKFFPFTRRKGSADIRTKGGGGNEGGTRTGRHDANRHSIGSYSSVSNRSMVIQLIRGAYNIDLAKVDQSFTKLHKSCFLNQDLNKIRKYLKQGANPNQLDNVSRSSPLHLATVNGNINVIRLLIEHGGNIDLTDGDGKTLAIKAVECFHKECLQFLILQGADLNVGDNLTGNTVLHWSIVNNFPDGLRLCLAYSGRIDVNRKNKLGESALHLLVKYPDLRGFISDLLDKGAEIDLRNNLQQTPLMVACEHGHLEAARALINRGSYIYLQDESGFTALGIAQRNGHVALVQYLTDLGGFDQPNRRESQVTRNELKSTAIDSWPSTEEEDENEIAEKTRKFDPIIQQLKSLQGGVGENGKQMPKLLQSIEPNQQQMRRSGIKANNDQEQSTSSSANQLKPSLSQQQQQQQQSNYGKGQSMASNTRIVADDDDDDDDNEDDDNTMMTDKLNNSMKISNGDNRVTSESRSTVKAVDLVPQNLTSLGHIDSVYSHGTSNDEFIKEIKNLLDEEIRENDELDALLFSTSFNSPANVTKITTSLIGQQNVNDDADVDDQSTYQQDNHQLTRKIVNNKSESIQQPSALRELSPLPFSSQPATSTNNFNSKSSTTDHVNLKGGQSKSKNVIHVDILSDLWEDWEEDEGKSDVEDEGKMKIEASSLLPETAIKTISSKSHIKDSISTPESTAQPSPPSPPPPPPPPAIQSNGQEVLGTFFLNNISDDEDEDESNVEIDLGDELPMKVNGQASRGRNMKEDGDKVEDNDQNGEDKRRKEGEVKKDGKSSEAERIRRNLVVKEDGNVFSSSTTHQPETFSSSLTPILRFEAISSSIDKKSNANLITSQSSSSPPLPPPPPPPPVSFTPLSPPLSTTGSSFPPPPPPPLPPALPPRPSNRLTIDNLKDKSIDLHRTSTEVQTELDQLTPRLTELERLWMESENKVKTLEIQLSKQAREADEDCNQLRAKIKCLEKDKKLLENQLVEMKESEERLMSEKKVLTLREAKLLKQLDSYEECKCSELKLELKAVKESVKSRRNHNNDEFIRKLHDLNDECNDLRRELTAEQTSLKEEINQLEKEKEMFKLENQWLKDKLDEMRIQMRKHFLLSSDDQMKVSLTPLADQLDQNQKESDGRSGKFKRKQDKDGEEGEEDDDDGHLSVNDRNETLGEMRKTMVSVESLCRKLDDKISTLNLEEQKKLMEKIIVEIAKTQINLQVETMFKGIRSLLEDLHRELISFQVTIEKQQQQQQQSQQFNSYNQVQQSADDNEKVNLDLDENDDDFHHDHQEKQLKDESSSCSTTTKKIISNGFSVFESRISQLTSSIEKLEDNIERQELNMLIQARGHFWSALTDPMGINMGTEHYRQDVNNNSLLINLINSTDCSKQSIQRRPQSVFVQSLMRLQKTPVDSKTNYPKLIHNQNSTNNYLNYEPSIVGDFHFTKNNLSKQIAHLKSELGLSR